MKTNGSITFGVGKIKQAFSGAEHRWYL